VSTLSGTSRQDVQALEGGPAFTLVFMLLPLPVDLATSYSTAHSSSSALRPLPTLCELYGRCAHAQKSAHVKCRCTRGGRVHAGRCISLLDAHHLDQATDVCMRYGLAGMSDSGSDQAWTEVPVVACDRDSWLSVVQRLSFGVDNRGCLL
jgi:hypothetical protein